MATEPPASWIATTYDAVAAVNQAILSQATPPKEVIQYLDISSITRTGVLGEPREVTFGEAPSRARRIVNEGDTVVSCVRPYLRAFARVKKWQRGLTASTGFAVLSPTRAVDGEFLYQSVLRDEFGRHLEDRMTGSSYPAVNADDVALAPLLLPPLPEQKKIAAILSSVDDAIQATQTVIDQTRQVKKGLLQELLTRGIGPDGRPHTRFKKTEIGEIPESWEVHALADIASVQRGRFSHRPRNAPHLYGGQYPFVQTGDIGAAEDLLVRHSQTLNEDGLQTSRLFPPGTIFITIAANIGDVALTTYSVACPDSVVGIIPKKRVDANWLLYSLALGKKRLAQAAPESAQKNINLQTLRPLRLRTPPFEEQKRIAATIDVLRVSISVSLDELAGLSAIKAGLLQDLLTGNVRVTP